MDWTKQASGTSGTDEVALANSESVRSKELEEEGEGSSSGHPRQLPNGGSKRRGLVCLDRWRGLRRAEEGISRGDL